MRAQAPFQNRTRNRTRICTSCDHPREQHNYSYRKAGLVVTACRHVGCVCKLYREAVAA